MSMKNQMLIKENEELKKKNNELNEIVINSQMVERT